MLRRRRGGGVVIDVVVIRYSRRIRQTKYLPDFVFNIRFSSFQSIARIEMHLLNNYNIINCIELSTTSIPASNI